MFYSYRFQYIWHYLNVPTICFVWYGLVYLIDKSSMLLTNQDLFPLCVYSVTVYIHGMFTLCKRTRLNTRPFCQISNKILLINDNWHLVIKIALHIDGWMHTVALPYLYIISLSRIYFGPFHTIANLGFNWTFPKSETRALG